MGLLEFKARLVALGYGQVSGVDVFNTSTPVVKNWSVQCLLDNYASHKLFFSMINHI